MIIINGRLITWGKDNQIVPEGMGLLIRDGMIENISPQNELLQAFPDEDWLDAGGQGKVKSIGKIRSMVREMLSNELSQIDELVKEILK